MGFDQIKYNNEYNKANYAKVTALIPKHKQVLVKRTAEQYGISVSQLIIRALEAQYGIDLSK